MFFVLVFCKLVLGKITLLCIIKTRTARHNAFMYIIYMQNIRLSGRHTQSRFRQFNSSIKKLLVELELFSRFMSSKVMGDLLDVNHN